MCIFTPTLTNSKLISFGVKYWLVLLTAAFLAAAGVAFFLYSGRMQIKEIGVKKARFLMVLRFLSFFFIAFLLLSPFVQSIRKIVQYPLVVLAWDNSASMKFSPDSAEIIAGMKSLRQSISEALSEKFQVAEYTFGEDVKKGDLLFNEKESDYSELINTVAANHFNDNIGALVIAGDGIYNQGKDPVNLAGEIQFPVYTIGFGDTTEIVDARIRDIRTNRTSFSGNRFPVEVDVQFLQLKGQPLKLSVTQDGRELDGIMVTPPSQNYFFTHEFVLEAGTPGLKHFSISISEAETETNTRNNSSGFVINVLENKQKILILSGGPHPDIGAIKNTLEAQKSYEVSVFTAEPYPSDFSSFNLLVLYQLPTPAQSADELLKMAERNRLPVLFVVGNRTFIPQMNALNQGVKIALLARSGEEAQASLNPAFTNFSLSEGFREALPQFPPLQVPFANFEMDAAFTPLFYQKIRNLETSKPLIATGIINGRKTGFIFGEGIWRWRLFDYYMNQHHANFSEIVNQLVQYLALRENEDNFVVHFKPVYSETEDIVFSAEVYNDAYERITTQEVNISIADGDKHEYPFTFDVQGESYRLNAGHLPVGDYSFTATVKIGSETFSENGNFTVIPVNFEAIETRANHQVLYQLSKQSGGNFYLPGQTGLLVQDIESNEKLKPGISYQEMIEELITLKWLFFAVLSILAMEWFLRKYWGIY